TTTNLGQGSHLEVRSHVRNPTTLGEVYTAVTRHIGFHPNDEGKVMGLAPYGSAKLVDDLKDLITLEPGGGYRVNFEWF
ncbi:carbamoyltransferase N-terminal domain-containing protein, partial [Vibrio parahaemolyticus]